MIPHILHYCWMGGAPMPSLAEQCIASWHKYMPEWKFMRWDEDSLTRAMQEPNPNNVLRTATGSPIEQSSSPVKGRTPRQAHNQSQDTKIWLDFMPTYVKQAYEARKFAFVSDYVRLWALEQYGGLYMDVDFEVFRSFDDLMDKYPAIAGYEGSKRQPVMMGVIASVPHGAWVRDMLSTYENRTFYKSPLTGNPSPVTPEYDLTPNTGYFTDRLEAQGFVADGEEKDFFLKNERVNELESEGVFMLHVFPVHYFCPVLTTGEDVRTPETYCEHKGKSSWAKKGWKGRILSKFSPALRTKIIKIKRSVLG